MSNRLKNESSPYLLQHSENPVDWYPWCAEAFLRAKTEDKPVFLSIGYSSCHWCHVMERESFESPEIAGILNRGFISVKVDREERPDIDSVYMSACLAFSGSGGWPASIFMTPDQKPFFAGTYFPPQSRGGMPGFGELLGFIENAWRFSREKLLGQSGLILSALKAQNAPASRAASPEKLFARAEEIYKHTFDAENGGFGGAPKFPAPHNLMFLLKRFETNGDSELSEMAQKTLVRMYMGGIFDHIGGGFFRYSTDEKFLIPHFEKMLCDNALMIMACCRAYRTAKKEEFLKTAQRTADFVLREMTSPEGGFYSSLDADSDGEEGKFYLFTPTEVENVLGKSHGREFCRLCDVTERGNFGKGSLPNLLKSGSPELPGGLISRLYRYRQKRFSLRTDDKIPAFWNGLMTAAMCSLYRASRKGEYLSAALKADSFAKERLLKNGKLYVSFRGGKSGPQGFLDDYAGFVFSQLALYGATLNPDFLSSAGEFCKKAIGLFGDKENGGFFLTSAQSEKLILRPKETFDGALPSGNSLMAWNLVRLAFTTQDAFFEKEASKQLDFLSAAAAASPSGHAMFLLALCEHEFPPPRVTVVPGENFTASELPFEISEDVCAVVLEGPTTDFPLKNGLTTFYVCKGRSCLPASNNPAELP